MDIEDVLLWAGALLQTEHPEEALQLARTYDNHPIPSWIEGFYYGNLSYVALQGGDLALAREWLTRARAAESRYQAMFDYIEALIVLAEGDSQGALERLAALSEVSIYDYNYPYLNIWYGHTIAWDQARIYRGLEDYDNALASYEGLIDEYGWWYIPYVERAELYLLLDNREAAREDLRNALQRVEDPAIRAEIQQQLESLIELD
jgi:tetratricopeptide (TPR) repeat protein